MANNCKPTENGIVDKIVDKQEALSYGGQKKAWFDLIKRKRRINGNSEVVSYDCKYPGCEAVLSFTYLEDGKVHLRQLQVHEHELPDKKRTKEAIVKTENAKREEVQQAGSTTESRKNIPSHPHICDLVMVQKNGVAEASSICQRVNPTLPSYITRIDIPCIVEKLADGRFKPGPSDVVLVCDEAAMLAKEVQVQDMLKRVPPAQAFSTLLQDAVDVTGENVFMLFSKDAASGGPRPGSLLAGRSTRLGAAILQVDNQERIASIRRNYQTLIALDKKIGSRVKRFKSKRPSEFLMTGYCLILTDQKAVGPGYAAAIRFEDEAELHPDLLSDILGQIADDVWAEVIKCIPELEKFSSRIISEKSNGFTIGKTPFNMMSLAKNLIVRFHMDINDAHWTLIVWLHGGIGPIINGCFGLPALGLRFLPTTLTVALFNAASITHGTEECIIPEGSSACRFGSSHFLRTPDLENLICLRLGAESKGLTLEELKEAAGARRASASSICALRTELIAAGKAEFRLDTDGQKAWKDPAVDWRDYV